MKKLYKVKIREEQEKIEEIEAESKEKALIKAEEGFYKGNYVLDGIDSIGNISFNIVENDKKEEDEEYG